jgi:hypothetical protein
MGDMKRIGESVSKVGGLSNVKFDKKDLNFLKKQYEFEYIFQQCRDKSGLPRYKVEIKSKEDTNNNMSHTVKPYMVLKDMDKKTKRLGTYKMVPDDGRELFQFGQFRVYELAEYKFKQGKYEGKSFRYLKHSDKQLIREM